MSMLMFIPRELEVKRPISDEGTFGDRSIPLYPDRRWPKENVGVGDVDAIEQEPRLVRAAERGMADPFIQQWPQTLGRGWQVSRGQLYVKRQERATIV